MRRSRIGPKTYDEARARHKPMKRSAMAHGTKRMKRASVSPEEKAWREAVLDRDRRKCRWPTENDSHHRGRLHAHHINERSQRPDLVYDISNGATLCSFHHDYAHHSVMGRRRAKELGLLGGETYEAAQKKQRVRCFYCGKVIVEAVVGSGWIHQRTGLAACNPNPRDPTSPKAKPDDTTSMRKVYI